jgi:hypothetical protein
VNLSLLEDCAVPSRSHSALALLLLVLLLLLLLLSLELLGTKLGFLLRIIVIQRFVCNGNGKRVRKLAPFADGTEKQSVFCVRGV